MALKAHLVELSERHSALDRKIEEEKNLRHSLFNSNKTYRISYERCRVGGFFDVVRSMMGLAPVLNPGNFFHRGRE